MLKPMPMLATPSTNTDSEFRKLMATGDWAADVKLDGVRCWLHWTGTTLTLLNRNHVDITARFPEVHADLSKQLAGTAKSLIDGEIVARDNSFETTLTRDKQSNAAAIAKLAISKPCTFFGFDVPSVNDVWSVRREILETMPIQATVLSDSADFLSQTRTLGLEGVIAKRRNARYDFSRRSPNWLKFKNVVRVTCLAYAYTPGTGRRAHFGAMQLALLDDKGNPVSVGRVGTGFTEKEITYLKASLDAGTPLAVEIECLNKTANNQLRFPSYKGVRTDVPVSDCSIHQLDYLTTC